MNKYYKKILSVFMISLLIGTVFFPINGSAFTEGEVPNTEENMLLDGENSASIDSSEKENESDKEESSQETENENSVANSDDVTMNPANEEVDSENKVTEEDLTQPIVTTANENALPVVRANKIEPRSVSTDIEYTFDVKWANVAGPNIKDYSYDEDKDPNHNNLIFTPVDVQQKIATLQYSVEINNDPKMVLPVGSIQIKVPSYLFRDWQDREQGSQLNLVDGYGKFEPNVTWQLPKAPETSSVSDFHYKDNGDGTYTVTNFKPIAGGSKLFFEQAFPFKPHLAKVDDQGVQNREINIEFQIDQDMDGAFDVTTSRQLNTEIHNQSKEMSVNLKAENITSNNGVFFDWQDVWGEKPADAKDYFYVIWYADLARPIHNTIPYRYELSLDADTPKGELIGAQQDPYSRGNSFYNIDFDKRPDATDTSYKEIAKTGSLDSLKKYGLNEVYRGGQGAQMINGVSHWNFHSTRYSLLTRYPVSLLKEAKEQGIDLVKDGLPIKTKATLKTIVQNGTVYTATSDAEQKIHVYPYHGVNQIWKYDAYNRNGRSNMAGTRTFLLNRQDTELRRASNISTFTTHVKGSPLSEPQFDNAIGDYVAKPYTAEIVEGRFYDASYANYSNYYSGEKAQLTAYHDDDITYKSVKFIINSYDAKKSELGGWTINTNADATNKKTQPIEVYIRKTGEQDYSLYGKLSFEENGQYHFVSEDGTVDVKNAKNKEIPLPKDVSGLKYKVTSSYYSYDFYAHTVIEGHPTEHMITRLKKHEEDKKDTLLTTEAEVKFTEGDLSKEANTEGQPLSQSSVYLGTISSGYGNQKLQQGNVIDDPKTGIQTRKVFVNFRQYSSLYDSGIVEKDYLKSYIYKEGTLYDLLPAGVTVPQSSIELSSGPYWNQTKQDFDVEMIQNWENSGQTMMKIHYVLSDEHANPQTFKNHDFTLKLYYDMQNSYNNIIDRGYTLYNTIALEITPPQGYDYVLEGGDKTIASLRDNQKYYDKLINNNPKNWRFAGGTITYNPVTVTQSGVIKEVKKSGASHYEAESNIFVGNQYSYHLGYTTSTNTRSDEIVFYDVLEQGDGQEQSEWQGTFDWLDTTSIEQKVSYGSAGEKCKPVLYYATTIPTEFNVDDANVWKEYQDGIDKATVKAIAVDCRKTDKGNHFVLDQGMGLNCFVYMVAPLGDDLDGKTAVNQTKLYARTFPGVTPSESMKAKEYLASAKVILHKLDLELHKSSDPITGTQQSPTEIENKKDTGITYTLTVNNKSSLLAMEDIHVEDEIPEGLIVDKDKIEVSSQALKLDKKLLSTISGLGANLNGQTLNLTIASLPKDGSVTFTIPTKLDEAKIQTTKFINTAKITSVEGQKVNVPSETTYHKVVQQYKLNYEVAGDSTYGYPEDSIVPGGVGGIEYDAIKELEKELSTKKTVAKDGTQGIWTFDGWYLTKDYKQKVNAANIKKDTIVYGKWKFVPTSDIVVTKEWQDEKGNPLKKAPKDRVTVVLYQDNQEFKTMEIEAGKQWKAAFENLIVTNPKTSKPYEYSIQEQKVLGYTTEVNGDAKTGYTIVNKKIPNNSSASVDQEDTIHIKIKKQWIDENNVGKQRPERIKVTLYGNKEQVKVITLTQEQNWEAVIENVPEYENGEKIHYSIQEDSVAHYTTAYSGTSKDGYVITNTLEGRISIPVTKIWKGKQGTNATIHLLADGKEIQSKDLNEENGWSCIFSDLPQKTEQGTQIKYSVVEDTQENYRSEITGDQEHGYIVTNTYISNHIDVKVTKKWDGQVQDSVTVYLKRNGEIIKSAVITNQMNWEYIFTDLESVDHNAQPYQYSVEEQAIKGYTVLIEGDQNTGFVITNSQDKSVTKTKEIQKNKKISNKKFAIHLPKTGDYNHIATYLMLFVLAMIALASIRLLKRQRQIRNHKK